MEDKLQNENVQTHNIASGDFVRVELDPEVFRAMHEEEYGWSNLMLAVSACIVTCLRCTKTRCILDLPTFFILKALHHTKKADCLRIVDVVTCKT